MNKDAEVLEAIGGPGAGKGTQAAIISKERGVPIMAASGLLKRVDPNTPRGAKIKAKMASGKLVPDSWVNSLVREALGQETCQRGVFLDGYPRTEKQAIYLNNLLTRWGVRLPVVVYLQVPLKVLVYRQTHRRICGNESCKRIYHLIDDPPPQPNTCHCGSALTQRDDDKSPTVIKARIKEFLEKSKPMIAFYRSTGQLITIRCGNKTKEQVSAEILKKLADWRK